jgi:hypothetical protein
MAARKKRSPQSRERQRAVAELYACKLQPIPTKEGEGALYLLYEGGALRTAHAVTPPDDARALARLLRGAGRRRVMRCAPDLARSGEALGFVPSPTPQAILEDRAACAVKTSMLGYATDLDNDACLALARASFDYFVAAPWLKWRGPSPVPARLELETIRSACSLELTGQQHPLLAGLLLSDEGELARSLGLSMPHQRKMLLGVVLGDRPAYAALAIDDAFRVRRVPKVAFSIGESEAPHGTWQVMSLAAAMRAAIALVSARGELSAVGTCRCGELEAKVTLDVPVH